jgi:hypothetical protein
MAYLQQPTSGTAGVALGTSFIAAVEDISGNIVVGDTSTVTLSLSHDTFASGATSVSATAANGMATFSGLTINTAGSYIMRADDTNPNLDPAYGPFTINNASAAKVGFLQQPSNASPGIAIAPAVTVSVQDAFGNTVSGDTSAVTLTLSSGTFSTGLNTVTVNAVNGVATFSNLIINTTGTYTLAASDGTLTGATSNSFSIAPIVSGITVNGGAAQRSRLTSIVVNFQNPVDFSTIGAITLTRTMATAFGTVGTVVNTSNGLIVTPSSGTVSSITLTFSNTVNAGIEYGSLTDGRWQLAIPNANYQSALNDTNLRRLFGDVNNDGTVDGTDFGNFGGVFAQTLLGSPFDFNVDGTVDGTDFGAFGNRFGLTL